MGSPGLVLKGSNVVQPLEKIGGGSVDSAKNSSLPVPSLSNRSFKRYELPALFGWGSINITLYILTIYTHS